MYTYILTLQVYKYKKTYIRAYIHTYIHTYIQMYVSTYKVGIDNLWSNLFRVFSEEHSRISDIRKRSNAHIQLQLAEPDNMSLHYCEVLCCNVCCIEYLQCMCTCMVLHTSVLFTSTYIHTCLLGSRSTIKTYL